MDIHHGYEVKIEEIWLEKITKIKNCVHVSGKSFGYQDVDVISHWIWSKIEKVPRGIRGEKSSKDMASSRNLVSTIGALASPKMGDGTRCPEG